MESLALLLGWYRKKSQWRWCEHSVQTDGAVLAQRAAQVRALHRWQRTALVLSELILTAPQR